MQYQTPDVTVQIDRSDDRMTLRWSHGTSIDFNVTPDSTIRGIQRVCQGGVDLRNPARLWRPVVETPEGIAYRAFRLRAAEPTSTCGVRVIADAIGYPTALMEDHDEYHGD